MDGRKVYVQNMILLALKECVDVGGLPQDVSTFETLVQQYAGRAVPRVQPEEITAGIETLAGMLVGFVGKV